MNPAESKIWNTKEPLRGILLQLQLIVQQTVPDAVLLYKYGIPYFYLKGKKPLVYLNITQEYVDLGFARGFQLKQHQEKLIAKNRNTVKSLRYYSEADIDQEILSDLLLEAKQLTT